MGTVELRCWDPASFESSDPVDSELADTQVSSRVGSPARGRPAVMLLCGGR